MKTDAAKTDQTELEDRLPCDGSFAHDGVLAQTLELVPELVLILDQHREVVLANRAAREALDCRQPELLGKAPGDLFRCERAQTAPCGCGTTEECRSCGAFQAILQAQQGQRAWRECRLSRQSAAGFEALDLRITCQPVTWHGEPHTVFLATDISAEKRKDVLERIFFHDILNLAGVVQGFVSLLADNLLTVDEIRQDLSLSAADLVCEIHSQQALLAAEKGSLELDLCRLNSRELLGEVRQAYARHPAANHRQLIVSPQAENFLVLTDRSILNRVMGNLVKNALEASSTGATITLGCRKATPGGVFSCHNPTCMPAPVRAQVFQRSFSTKGRGRGIGTYSVKLLTEKYLQGRVAFTSTPEAGTTFEVKLPDYPRFTPTEPNAAQASN